jgi:hypothetical protein
LTPNCRYLVDVNSPHLWFAGIPDKWI